MENNQFHDKYYEFIKKLDNLGKKEYQTLYFLYTMIDEDDMILVGKLIDNYENEKIYNYAEFRDNLLKILDCQIDLGSNIALVDYEEDELEDEDILEVEKSSKFNILGKLKDKKTNNSKTEKSNIEISDDNIIPFKNNKRNKREDYELIDDDFTTDVKKSNEKEELELEEENIEEIKEKSNKKVRKNKKEELELEEEFIPEVSSSDIKKENSVKKFFVFLIKKDKKEELELEDEEIEEITVKNDIKTTKEENKVVTDNVSQIDELTRLKAKKQALEKVKSEYYLELGYILKIKKANLLEYKSRIEELKKDNENGINNVQIEQLNKKIMEDEQILEELNSNYRNIL